MKNFFRFFSFVTLVMSGSAIKAQIAAQVIENYKRMSSVCYVQQLRAKDPFGEKMLTDTLRTELMSNDGGFVIRGNRQVDRFDGNKLFRLNLMDSTYRISKQPSQGTHYYRSLSHLMEVMERHKKNRMVFSRFADTVISGRKCFQLRVAELDTVKKGRPATSFSVYVVDQKNLLLVLYRNWGSGFVDGTDIYIQVFNEYHFSAYRINRVDIAAITAGVIPAYFRLEAPKKPLTLLSAGTSVPVLPLNRLDGSMHEANFLGKVTLVNFTVDGCPHCIASLGLLNRLHQKYPASDFQLLGINPFDDAVSIRNFTQRHGTSFPIYTITQKVASSYHVDSFPSFYVIGVDGKVVKGFSGYEQRMDREIEAAISAALGQRQ